MDLNEAGQGNPGRTEAFSQGTTGTPWNVASSLTQDSAAYNAQVPSKVTPTSVLQPYMPSGNGMSSEDAERMLPGGTMMESPNGSSSESYQAARYMRLMGKRAI